MTWAYTSVLPLRGYEPYLTCVCLELLIPKIKMTSISTFQGHCTTSIRLQLQIKCLYKQTYNKRLLSFLPHSLGVTLPTLLTQAEEEQTRAKLTDNLNVVTSGLQLRNTTRQRKQRSWHGENILDFSNEQLHKGIEVRLQKSSLHWRVGLSAHQFVYPL